MSFHSHGNFVKLNFKELFNRNSAKEGKERKKGKHINLIFVLNIFVQVKDFILNQPEAYEFKIGQEAFRRPGDPPLEVVMENLRKDKESKDEL